LANERFFHPELNFSSSTAFTLLAAFPQAAAKNLKNSCVQGHSNSRPALLPRASIRISVKKRQMQPLYLKKTIVPISHFGKNIDLIPCARLLRDQSCFGSPSSLA
jgi:hypothetical protein